MQQHNLLTAEPHGTDTLEQMPRETIREYYLNILEHLSPDNLTILPGDYNGSGSRGLVSTHLNVIAKELAGKNDIREPRKRNGQHYLKDVAF